MSHFRSFSLGLIATMAFLISGFAFAHPKLIAARPADHAEVSAPTTVEVSFSEVLMTQLSGADLTMTEMPGMTMGPMKIEAKTTASADGKSLVITPTQPLSPGTYSVDWHVVSDDTHAVKGSFSFRVK
jgi:methionine-rich copper-binding protein CopC